MAVTTTELLGTDSIAGSRIVLNDNFSILRDEINAIETYIDPDAGTIDGLNSLLTTELRVGQLGDYSLEITSTVFNINSDVVINGNIELTGLISNSSFGVIDEGAFTGSATIDPTVGEANYTIIHTSTGDFVIELGAGNPGQDVSFFVEQKGGGQIIIQAETSTVFVIDSVNSKVLLDDLGSSVTMRYVIDSGSNGSWFIVNSNNVTPTT